MGFFNIPTVIALILGTAKPKSLAATLEAGAYDALLVDISWLFHSFKLSRDCAVAMLRAHVTEKPPDIAEAMMLVLFSDKGCVGKLLAQMRSLSTAAPRLVLASERGSFTYDGSALVVAFLSFSNKESAKVTIESPCGTAPLRGRRDRPYFGDVPRADEAP